MVTVCDYDVIIVGGRPAGSTLAARLAKQHLRVLLLERGEFPSLPAASSPIIYAPTMKLLDEIGANEAEYARNTPKIHRLYFVGSGVNGGFPIPEHDGRDYGYAIDRARFDDALWRHAASFPTVTARDSFHVTDLAWEGERVMGIIGKQGADGETETITADLVVGADGRFSMVARKVGALASDEHEAFPTTLHYAYWKHVKQHENGEPTSVTYEGAPGIGYLVMDSADDTTAVCIEGQADLLVGKPDELYINMLQKQPALWSRLQDAEMVTDVRGMRKIANLYHQAGGPGWALVGDAYHQKDPLDGQGIYNAAFTAKALAWAIRYWRTGEKTWEDALDWYDETARIKTYPMYKTLLLRIQETLYASPNAAMPEWLQEHMGRWVLNDPAFGELIGRYITRQIPPDVMTVMTPPLLVNAMLRGSLRDLRQRVEKRLSVR